MAMKKSAWDGMKGSSDGVSDGVLDGVSDGVLDGVSDGVLINHSSGGFSSLSRPLSVIKYNLFFVGLLRQAVLF